MASYRDSADNSQLDSPFVELSAFNLFDELACDFINQMASQHLKRCDECWGRGYIDVGYMNDEIVTVECPRCIGSGLQHAS